MYQKVSLDQFSSSLHGWLILIPLPMRGCELFRPRINVRRKHPFTNRHVAQFNSSLTTSPLVPLDTFSKGTPFATKDVQCTTDGQVHFASRNLVNEIQIGNGAAAASVSDRDTAPVREVSYELLINACLEALVVCSVD